jgi:hypothetical protein
VTWRFCFLLVCLLAIGCAYSTSSRTAKGIKSVAVPFFDNRTAEPNLELRVTEMIIDNLVADNTLKVVDETEADALLDGAIVEFRNLPFSFDRELNAQEYQVIIKVNVTLFNRRLNEPIWENMTIKGDGSYFIDSPTPGLALDDAIGESIFEITERILNLTVQDW